MNQIEYTNINNAMDCVKESHEHLAGIGEIGLGYYPNNHHEKYLEEKTSRQIIKLPNEKKLLFKTLLYQLESEHLKCYEVLIHLISTYKHLTKYQD
jgi:Tat protein secretion system quality control protein TatD with DNase activity